MRGRGFFYGLLLAVCRKTIYKTLTINFTPLIKYLKNPLQRSNISLFVLFKQYLLLVYNSVILLTRSFY